MKHFLWLLPVCTVGVGGLLLAAVSNLEDKSNALLAKAPFVGERFQRPDWDKMRAYRVGKLTDQQLLDLHAKAVEQFEEHKRSQAEDGRKFWEERKKRQQACESNPATILRNPNGCFEPLPIGFEDIGRPALGLESPEKFFEYDLMGVCNFVDNVRRAKQVGCLPD